MNSGFWADMGFPPMTRDDVVILRAPRGFINFFGIVFHLMKKCRIPLAKQGAGVFHWPKVFFTKSGK
ncbi:hypothetical protein GEU84_017895 [Fertoebacter nigrum]|uniref:Uncharacterized protein n=1 Tax=Fertoeibacter niger TaxID=2656921 RepID=A0A8X8H5W9_9RHOB|nr:hypothetical protein [Fertoeibacter niger]NUB46268.1 hypothetical protein [Fertoeibacter niger]